MAIWIKKLIAERDDGKKSDVEFTNKVNFIKGSSNTGKSVILAAIDFVLGSEEKKFKLKRSYGYCKFSLELCTQNGSFVISRSFGDKDIVVESFDSSIKSGTYSLDSKCKTKPYIGTAFLKLIGINENLCIPKNKSMDPESLSWRNILKTSIFSQTRISTEESILLPVQNTQQTSMLSTLLFLIFGKDACVDDEGKSEEKRISRKAQKEFADQKLEFIKKKMGKAQITPDELEEDIESQIQNLSKSISDTQQQILDVMNDSKEMATSITKNQSDLADMDMMIARYDYLKSQYESDIQRLEFIVKSGKVLSHKEHDAVCPLCNSHYHVDSTNYSLDGYNYELEQTIAKLTGLNSTISEVKLERDAIEASLELRKTIVSVNDLAIETELKPQITDLNKQLSRLQEMSFYKAEYSLLKEMKEEYENDVKTIEAAEAEAKAKKTYSPKKNFPEKFAEELTQSIQSFLKEIHYQSYEHVKFDINLMDITIDGEEKASSEGFGRRSILNTVTVLALNYYLASKTKHLPGFVIIDSPLLGLDETDSADPTKIPPEALTRGLLKLLSENPMKMQLIVFVNGKNLPVDVDFGDANVIEFTKSREHGRYGFLEGVYDMADSTGAITE